MDRKISLVDAYLADKVVDISVLNFEDGRYVHFTEIYGNGEKKTRRVNVKSLPNCYRFLTPKPIVAAEFVGKLHTGLFRETGYLLFAVRLQDGTAQLIQSLEGTKDSLRLLQLSDEGEYQSVQPAAPKRRETTVQPHPLQKNELPQGRYLIGRDIPPGTYDFFVVYGHGGKLSLAKYDERGEIINGTWNFYWVGRKEGYEHREVLHVKCEAGYTVEITGNVVLKIARSQRVRINL